MDIVDTLDPTSINDAVPVALLLSVYLPVAVSGRLVVVPGELVVPKVVVAPLIVPAVMFPFPSRLRLPMKVTGGTISAASPAIIVIVYVPDRLAAE